MYKIIIAAFACLSMQVGIARAEFVGDLELLPPGCEKTGICRLGKELGFIDPNKIGWLADKDLMTDGASIPPWAQRFVGGPFEKDYIRAAVIHDHFCDRHVRPWRQTHRVFYDALIESGVSKKMANILYFAVMVGGPKWTKVIKGKPCALGMSCINNVPNVAELPGAQLTLSPTTETLLTRENLYGSAQFANIMANNVPELEKDGDNMSPQDVEKKAAEAMNGDFYFSNGDEIGGSLKLQVK